MPEVHPLKQTDFGLRVSPDVIYTFLIQKVCFHFTVKGDDSESLDKTYNLKNIFFLVTLVSTR